MAIPKEQLSETLHKHKLWRGGIEGGEYADLRGADLRRANLQGADLQDANLQGANLQDANLQGADLQDADLQDANLQGADLRRANLQGADLRRADLRRANLQGANLQGADLRGADLRRANLQGANLQDANLRRANLQGANLQDANLRKTRLSSPTEILQANWGHVSDDTTAVLMRYDATCHPLGIEAFKAWVEGGQCPYHACCVTRAANFQERKESWKDGPLPTPWEAMCTVLNECCPGWNEQG